MEIDINFQLAYYTTNVNVMGMHWKTFGTAFWYDARLEDYHHACMRATDIVWNEIYEQFPHLKGTTFDYTESGDMPVIEVEKQFTPMTRKEIIDAIQYIPNSSFEPDKNTHVPTLSEQLNSCTEKIVLESYKFIVRGKPEEKIYKAKLKELSK